MKINAKYPGLSSRHFDYGILWQKFYQRDNEISLVYGNGIQNNPLKYLALGFPISFQIEVKGFGIVTGAA